MADNKKLHFLESSIGIKYLTLSVLFGLLLFLANLLGSLVSNSNTPKLTSESDYTRNCRQLIKDAEALGDAFFKTDSSSDVRVTYFDELGHCYATLWRFPEALATFEKAYELNSTARLGNYISELKEIIEGMEWERNIKGKYYVTRDLGPAVRLTGKIVVAYLFVETNKSQWSSLDRQQAISTLKFAQQWLISQSKNYQTTAVHHHRGRQIRVANFFEPTFVNRIFQIKKDRKISQLHKKLKFSGKSQIPLARYAVHKLGFNGISSFLNRLKSEELADNALLMIHLNKTARSFAEPCRHRWCNVEATFVLESVKNARWQSLHYLLAHEPLHLFGADDLYNIRGAKNYASADIMHYASRYLEDSEIRSLTAYAIGWTDVTPKTPFPIHQLGE